MTTMIIGTLLALFAAAVGYFFLFKINDVEGEKKPAYEKWALMAFFGALVVSWIFDLD
jgi:hypothetical protein